MVSEITNNDRTVIYELPIPLASSAAALPPKETPASTTEDKSTSTPASSIEVPASSRPPTPRPKLPPFILPVYHTIHEEPISSSSFGSYRHKPQNSEGKLFGIPTFIFLEQEDEDGGIAPITQERIYEAVLGQYRRWTERADHLYNWRAGDADGDSSSASDPDKEKVVPNGHLSVASTTDSLNTVVASPSIEGDEDAMKIDYEAPSGPPPASPQPIYVGPKLDLFKVALKEAPQMYQTKQQQHHIATAGMGMTVAYDSAKPVSWADRTIVSEEEESEEVPDEEEGDIADEAKLPSASSEFVPIDMDATPDPTEHGDANSIELDATPTITANKLSAGPQFIQLKASDILRCEWDAQFLEYYFGPQGRGDGALWERFNVHVDPSLPSPEERQAASKKTITLEDCLEEFCREERLGEDDLWYCPNCKKHQQATKQFQIWKVPDVLVVHLKRFSNSRLLRDKIDAMVDFPVEGLDLSKRVGEKLFWDELERDEDHTLEGIDMGDIAHEGMIYDLFAVDEHLGGMGGGHYRAHALNADDNQWYWYDDAHVSKCRAEDAVVSSS